MIGFASDGASVMKCICHSLALASLYASKKPPSYLEELLQKICCYLRYSSKRQLALGDLQVLFDIPEHRMLKLCKTRWLSLESVIHRTIEQYPALLKYFETGSKHRNPDDAAFVIYEGLKNPYTVIYLEFLAHVLRIVNNENVEFQADETKIHSLYSKMKTIFKSVLGMYMDEEYIDNYDTECIKFEKKNDKWLPVERIDIGCTAKADLNSLTSCKAEDKYIFRKVCQEFLIELAKQINMRFPIKERNIKML